MWAETLKQYFQELPFEVERIDLDSNIYVKSYPALLDLGAKVPAANSYMQLALAVYGWMPRVLHVWHDIDSSQLGAIKNLSNSGDDLACARTFLSKFNGPAPVGNSWAGTSKFLHFVNPNVFPIWDAKIADFFGVRHSANNMENYIKWLDALHATQPAVGDHVEKFQRRVYNEYGYTPGVLRSMEFLVYSRGRSVLGDLTN